MPYHPVHTSNNVSTIILGPRYCTPTHTTDQIITTGVPPRTRQGSVSSHKLTATWQQYDYAQGNITGCFRIMNYARVMPMQPNDMAATHNAIPLSREPLSTPLFLPIQQFAHDPVRTLRIPVLLNTRASPGLPYPQHFAVPITTTTSHTLFQVDRFSNDLNSIICKSPGALVHSLLDFQNTKEPYRVVVTVVLRATFSFIHLPYELELVWWYDTYC